MTNEQALKILQEYSHWRKGGNTKMPSTVHIGMAIDHAITVLSNLETSHYRKIIVEQFDEERRLRDKYEGKQNGYKYAHRAAALRDLLKKIVVMLVFIPVFSFGQRNKNFWLKQGIAATTMLAAGWLQGANEVAVNDYRRFAARHPAANPKFSNPRISFKRKYENFPTDKSPAYFGSTTFLAWTSDRHHLYNTTRNFLVAGNIGITMSLYEKPNWKQIVLQAAASWAFFALGSGAAHYYYKPID